MLFIQRAQSERETYVSETSGDPSLSEGRLGVKDWKEKAMQGCRDLQLCFHPPMHPSLYSTSLYSLLLSLSIFRRKGRKPSVGVIYYRRVLVQHANVGGYN